MKGLKIAFLLSSVIFFSLILFFAPPSSGAVPGGNNDGAAFFGKKIKIALLLPTTGKFAYFGKQFINGLLLSERNSGPSKIGYIIVNLPANADGKNIGYIFSSLSEKGISAVIGPLFPAQVKYFEEDSYKFKIPVITPSPVIPSGGSPYTFSYGMTLREEVMEDMRIADKRHVKSLAVIYPDNGYGKMIISLIDNYANKYNVNIIEKTAYSDKTYDFFNNFNSIVTFPPPGKGQSNNEEPEPGDTTYDLMQNVTKEKPVIPFDGLFVAGGVSKLKLILVQLAFYNITGFPIIGLSTLNSSSFVATYGKYMENSIYPDGFYVDGKNPVVSKFVSSFRKYYDNVPNILSAEGYDIGGLLAKASRIKISKYSAYQDLIPTGISGTYNYLNPDINGIIFYKKILKMGNYYGVCGISVLKGNRFEKKLYMFNFKNGKIAVLENPFSVPR